MKLYFEEQWQEIPFGQKRSSDIREQLSTFNINDKLTQCNINLREHIQRMDDNRLPKKIKLQT